MLVVMAVQTQQLPVAAVQRVVVVIVVPVMAVIALGVVGSLGLSSQAVLDSATRASSA